jgi:transcriptional regulator with GAF, ATPase, and Fis domain
MQDLEQLAELLVAADPGAATDALLRYLCRRHSASGGLVLSLQAGEPVVKTACSLDLGRVASVDRLWSTHQRGLRSGRPVYSNAHALVPLMEGETLVGALYLDEPRQLEPDRLGPFVLALSKALAAAASPTRPRLDHGALLQRALDENAWNVARVARALGVTRRTVYMRMQRFGIPRRRVPKVLKPS